MGGRGCLGSALGNHGLNCHFEPEVHVAIGFSNKGAISLHLVLAFSFLMVLHSFCGFYPIVISLLVLQMKYLFLFLILRLLGDN